jgi:hypothetical protein
MGNPNYHALVFFKNLKRRGEEYLDEIALSEEEREQEQEELENPPDDFDSRFDDEEDTFRNIYG